MNASEDVKTLFRRFGGEPGSYQEVGKEQAVGQALDKWAMLGQVDISHPQAVASVRRVVKTAAIRPLTEGAQEEPLASTTSGRPTEPQVEAKVVAAPAAVTTPTNASIAVVKRPKVGAQSTDAESQSKATTPAPKRKSKPASADPKYAPVGLRTKSSTPAPVQEPEPATSQTLSGLFGRLSKPAAPASKPSVLRRNFYK